MLTRTFLLLRTDARLRVLAILLPPLAVMVWGLHEPVHGMHVFRQAHVAANVEKYAQQGLSLRPQTYNLDAPASLYDFPLFQLLAAELSRRLGTPPLPTTRATGIIVFALTVLALDRLLQRTSVRPAHALFVLAFFAWAPLVAFFFAAPLVDGLAVLLALVSVLGYTHWADEERGSGLVVMAVAGALSALIKNPVYLPFLLAMLWHRARTRGLRAVATPPLAASVGLIGFSVVAFKLYANHVNQVPGLLGAGETAAYFGSLLDRLTWTDSWSRIVATLGLEVLNPVTAILALYGFVTYTRGTRSSWRHLYIGAAVGGAAAVLVFFNRHRGHDYYQLPLVPACAFFAGYGLYRLLIAALRPPRRSPAMLLALVAVLGISIAAAGLGFRRITRGEFPDDVTGEMTAGGDWIRARTEPTDFVVYLRDTHPGDWNPAWLYFAGRDGFNLSHVQVREARLRRLARRFAPRYGRILVFCPAYLVPALGQSLESWGLHLLHVSSPGRLYLLEAAEPEAAPP